MTEVTVKMSAEDALLVRDALHMFGQHHANNAAEDERAGTDVRLTMAQVERRIAQQARALAALVSGARSRALATVATAAAHAARRA